MSLHQVRQQLYINASGEKFSPSFMATLVRMVQTEGPLSIFKGLSVRVDDAYHPSMMSADARARLPLRPTRPRCVAR